jgi:hypothetical protein
METKPSYLQIHELSLFSSTLLDQYYPVVENLNDMKTRPFRMSIAKQDEVCLFCF